MDKQAVKRSVELCLAVYRLTDRFPKEEILRSKIRRLSVAIIESLVYKISYPNKKLRVLFLCFDIADKQGWADSRNYEILKQEYVRLRDGALALQGDKPIIDNRQITDNQKEIIKFLQKKENGAAIPVVSRAVKKSSRTVARELKMLVKNKIVMKRGKTKGTKFFVINNGSNMAVIN
jgi:hypothetical protein